ncbi:MAG: hypothetical protein BMS9Abin34_394 [Patescibacteria group bacterium]|nr:MAG: hypothetical protein BMS9Abin34_394 [Patescibacteria group bacterium]
MEELKQLKKKLLKKDLEIKKLRELTTKDPLTKLLNRKGFTELAQKLFEDAKFHAQNPEQRTHFVIDAFSILFFDIDNFKKINDTYGHETGDKILKFVTAVISEKLRTSDFIGRWGGEEIIVALVGAGEKDAYQKAEEIRKAIKSRVKIPNFPQLTVTVSVGVAQLKENPSLESLIKQADQAMYHAKQTGKDRVVRLSEIK